MANTQKSTNKATTEQCNKHIVSVSDLQDFISWLDSQKCEYRGGVKMYDVQYYKWLTQGEMLDYWLERVHSR